MSDRSARPAGAAGAGVVAGHREERQARRGGCRGAPVRIAAGAALSLSPDI